MKENKFKTKQEQKNREALRGEIGEAITKSRRIIKEEPKKIKVEVRRKEELDKTGIRVYKKSLLPKPSIIRSELASRRLEPKVALPSENTLTDRQRMLLYILYNMFKGKNIKNMLNIISKALEIDVEDLLQELIILENLRLIVVDNGIVNFTSKGEILVGTITINGSIITRIREVLAKVPKNPSINVSYVAGKSMDKKNHLAFMKTSRKRLAIPVFPKVHASNVILMEVDRSMDVYPEYRVGAIIIPQIPQLAISDINVKVIDRTAFLVSSKRYKVAEKPIAKITKKAEKSTESRGVRLPSSLLTMLFKPVKRYNAKGLLSVKPDRPVIIIAVKLPGEEYIATLLSILREIYRMKVGGLPIGRYTGTKVTKYIAEDELIRQGFIKVIDDSKADFLEFFKISKVEEFDNIDLSKLRDRLIELSVQGLSFLVFYINKDKTNSLLTYLVTIRDKIAPAKIVVIFPRELELDLKKELARASWGFVEPKEPLTSDTIDQHFKRREEEFDERLEKIATKRRYARIVRESTENEEGIENFESALHYQLKVFLVYYLINKLNIAEEDIETEIELLTNGKKIIPDIYVKSKRLAIEIETFYGTGFTPWGKLRRTIEKYVESNIADEVWIIIPPLQTMLYLKDLIGEVKDLKEKGYDFIKLYTINLSKGNIVPIEKISRRLGRLFGRLVK